MKQAQYSPMSVGQMAVALFAVDRGFMDDIELKRIGAFEAALLDSMKSTQTALMETLDGGNWNDDLEQQLKAAVAAFKTSGSW
jgi:F-type H+-transporting ATPase subunit alpha